MNPLENVSFPMDKIPGQLEEFSISPNMDENIDNAHRFFTMLFQRIKEFAADEGIKLVFGIVLLIVGLKLINVLTNKLKRSKLSKTVEPTMFSFLRSALNIGLKIVLIMTVASILGVPMTSLVAVIGSCGLAVGLALQGSLSNIAGGFMLAILKPFVVGDYIRTGEYEGTVKSINLFYTKIITLDNKLIVIPNSTVSNSALTDYNAFPTRRVDIEIGVSYHADPAAVRAALLEAARQYEGTGEEPAPSAAILSYDDSAVTYKLMFWVDSKNYWDAKFTVNENIKRLFNENGIEIPFPQLDVHFDNNVRPEK